MILQARRRQPSQRTALRGGLKSLMASAARDARIMLLYRLYAVYQGY